MSVCLLDVNVLLALGLADHLHHAAANAWFDRPERGAWATCAITECGFIRIAANPKLLPRSRRNIEDVLATIAGLRARSGHEFWPDDYSPADEPLFAKLQGHNQITDAYLLALCARHRGQLATFDTGLKAMAQDLLGDASRVLLIPER